MSPELALLDDDELVAERLLRSLRGTEWTVRSFAEEEPAVAHVLEHRPRVLLVDQGLPLSDGHEILLELAGRGALEHTRLVLSSAGPLAPSIRAALAGTAIEFLPKDALRDREGLLAWLAGPR